jgi:hypothetical protein
MLNTRTLALDVVVERGLSPRRDEIVIKLGYASRCLFPVSGNLGYGTTM